MRTQANRATVTSTETLEAQNLENGDGRSVADYRVPTSKAPAPSASAQGIGLAEPIRSALGISQQMALLLSTAAFAVAVVALVFAGGRRPGHGRRQH